MTPSAPLLLLFPRPYHRDRSTGGCLLAPNVIENSHRSRAVQNNMTCNFELTNIPSVVFTIPLRKHAESEANVGKRNTAIEPMPLTHRPRLNFPCPPSGSKNDVEDEIEDWDEDAMTLFEWIRTAGFGSQRLQVNHSVGPYIAVYEPPPNTFIGGMNHFSWRGVQKLLDAIIKYVDQHRQQILLSLLAYHYAWALLESIPSVYTLHGAHCSLLPHFSGHFPPVLPKLDLWYY
ncbi:hypothetical protein ONZ45_g2699 [Pleurotus djamor]|nr:hypothetical protein ONZ45_g2699 [Pleurotus djamor]